MDDFGLTPADAGSLALVPSYLDLPLSETINTGSIETVGDEDRFLLNVEAGKVYFVLFDRPGFIDDGPFESATPLIDPELRFFSLDGVAADVSASELTPAFSTSGERFIRAEETGSFLLSVTSASGAETGDYSVIAGVLPDAPEVTANGTSFPGLGRFPRIGETVPFEVRMLNFSGQTVSGMEVEIRARSTTVVGAEEFVLFRGTFGDAAALQNGVASGRITLPGDQGQIFDVTAFIDPEGVFGTPVPFQPFITFPDGTTRFNPPRRGTEGDDTFFAAIGPENLVIDGRGGNDSISGGADDDILIGNAGDDSLAGNFGEDRLFGGTGNDTADGGLGNDRIDGGDGLDVLFGGGGVDRIFGRGDDDRILGGDGVDILRGGQGDDFIMGEDGRDNILGEVGDDALHGGLERDRLFGGDGDDHLFGGEGDDQLRGGNGMDNMTGGSGNDKLFGGAEADFIDGGDGIDYIRGGDGADEIAGGTGRDVLLGEGGIDRFDFEVGDGFDKIQDFEAGETILIAGDTGLEIIQSPRGHWFIRYGDNDLIRVDTIGDFELAEAENVFLIG